MMGGRGVVFEWLLLLESKVGKTKFLVDLILITNEIDLFTKCTKLDQFSTMVLWILLKFVNVIVACSILLSRREN